MDIRKNIKLFNIIKYNTYVYLIIQIMNISIIMKCQCDLYKFKYDLNLFLEINYYRYLE